LVSDCPGQFPIGKLSPGNGFRPFRTRGDDGGRHHRRQQVNSVSMTWRFDRPDFLDVESHSGCRENGPDGRYFPPPELTPLIMVLQFFSIFRSAGAEEAPASFSPVRRLSTILSVNWERVAAARKRHGRLRFCGWHPTKAPLVAFRDVTVGARPETVAES